MPKDPKPTRLRPSLVFGKPSSKELHVTADHGFRFPGLSLAGKPSPSLSTLLDWLKENSIAYKSSIEIRSPEGDRAGNFGWSAWVRETDEEAEENDLEILGHDVACKIPRSAILSTRNSSKFTQLVPRSTWKQIPPIAQLSLVLLYEIRRWNESRWFGYLQSLPREPVPLATLWDLYGQDGQRGLKVLEGTSMDHERKRIKREGHSRQDLEVYLAATKAYFPMTTAFPRPPTMVDMLHAYSLVSSRAFQIDQYHGTAMVPLADIFNHTEAADLAFESDDFCCDECGSLPACEHDHDVEIASIGDASTIRIAPRFAHLPHEVIQSLSNPLRDCLDMTLNGGRRLRPGRQIFNSYGERLPWSKTLAEWGFIDDTSEVCRVYWEVGDVLDKDDDDHYEIRRSIWKRACGQVEVAMDMICVDETGVIARALKYLAIVARLSEDELEDKKKAVATVVETAEGRAVESSWGQLLRQLTSERLALLEAVKPSSHPGPIESLAWKLRKREIHLLHAALMTLE